MSSQYGYFLIADITGYTQYLTESELEHAQQTLTALLNLLISHTRPPLVISRLAGDAVISYGFRDAFLQGQTFVEVIEDTYVSFRRAIGLMVHNTTCPCNACRNIKNLDLKFFVHYGQFGIQKLDAHDELVGQDVILIHRLLKNHVSEQTGIRAYAIYTDAAIRQLGLADNFSGLVAHEESYEHFGTVQTWVQDMLPVWESKKREAQVRVTGDRELMRVATEIAMSPELVWDYLAQPKNFVVLLGAARIEITNRQAGRVAPGSVYQCFHGTTCVQQTILEWQPFELIVLQYIVPIPVKGVAGIVELRLEPSAMGTWLTQIFGKASGPLAGRLLGDMAMKSMQKSSQLDIDKFRAHIEADHNNHLGSLPTAAAIAAADVGAAALASLSRA